MSPDQFRANFPALDRWAWLDTPGSAPATTPVAEALRRAVDAHLSGAFDWNEWDQAADRARRQFAAWCRVPAENVATLGSLSEAAATVARFRREGTALLAADEFQSLLLPFLAEARRDPRRPTELVATAPGQSRSDAIIDRIRPGVSIVAVSETTTLDGERIDLAAVRERASAVGAELFVNGTQSLGALRSPIHDAEPDYFAVHGYKWMLAPRGAAWLYASSPASKALESIAPSWKTAAGGTGLFGGAPRTDAELARCDTSQAWLSWIGAEAALGLLARLNPAVIEEHVLELADRFEAGALALGAVPVRSGNASQIRVVRVADPQRVERTLFDTGVRARVVGDRLRIGVHGFNNQDDIERVLTALSPGRSSSSRVDQR